MSNQSRRVHPAADSDVWPHTTRVLPWLIAAFMVMVFWVPFDSTQLPISLPINSDLDRFVIGGMVLVWLVIVLGHPRAIRFHASPINVAIYLFLLAACVSLVVNLRRLAWDGELQLSLKELSLITSYLAAYFVISTSLRATEIRAFARLLVVLGVGTAAGTIYQYATHSNPFFSITQTLFVGAHVTPVNAGVKELTGSDARIGITGPALHPLANATLICTAFPFALCLAGSARRGLPKLAWWLAILLLITACFATGRKTALIVIAVDFVILIAFDRRSYGRYIFAVAAGVVVLLLASPHLVTSLADLVSHATSSTSTQARTADFPAVFPYISSHLLIGRGYGSFDPLKYRILDDQMLGWLVQIGVLGTAAYALMILAVPLTVFGAARRPLRLEDRLMQAVFAASVGYLVTNFTYDTFGFRQAPYTFFIVAGLGVAWTGRDRLSAPGYSQLVSVSRLDSARAGAGLAGRSVVPELSILIVTYRNPELTRDCLQAVQRAISTINAEVLVLDNDSPDDTPAMISREFDWLSFERSPTNLGFARANNVLAERATGKFILLLNPDAILHDGALPALLELAARHPEAGIYGGRTLRPSGELEPSSCWGFQTLWSLVCFATGLSRLAAGSMRFNPEALGAWQRDSVRRVDVITGCLLLMPRSVWQQLGGFDEDFWMYGEDQDLAVRARKNGFRPLITPDAVATHVIGASSSSGDKSVMVLGAKVRLMRKHWTPVKARLGIWMLQLGCGLRAMTTQDEGWREGWRRRREWAAIGV
jgi:N-acetylglucosaminyl-diphospho-decaprenol L-rhamnosyltransferase